MKLGDSKLGRQPQWLITCMEFPRAKVYQHAPVAMLALKNFIQVPQAVLRLEADDTALALGVASLWRHHVSDVLRGAGHYRATLQQLADAAGNDVAQQTRDRGVRAYYGALTERLPRIVRDGQLGELHLEGEGPLAVATLTPSIALATVYQSLAAPKQKFLDQDPKATTLVTRRQTSRRPRRGV